MFVVNGEKLGSVLVEGTYPDPEPRKVAKRGATDVKSDDVKPESKADDTPPADDAPPADDEKPEPAKKAAPPKAAFKSALDKKG